MRESHRRGMCSGLALLWTLSSGAVGVTADQGPRSLPRIGRTETIVLTLPGSDGRPRAVTVEAKVDTGARTSSLHAGTVRTFTRNGREHARFTFSWNGQKREIEAPIREEKRVKSSDGESEERRFVELEACLGTAKEKLVVSLNDRKSMRYPMLLGRRFLEDRFLVDVGREHLLGDPACR